jgi:hypothetical protein
MGRQSRRPGYEPTLYTGKSANQVHEKCGAARRSGENEILCGGIHRWKNGDEKSQKMMLRGASPKGSPESNCLDKLVPFQLMRANLFENALSVFARDPWAIIWSI